MKKAFVFLAEGFEEVEALTVVDLLRRAQIEVTTISLSGSLKVTGAHLISVTADVLCSKGSYSSGDALILPGGMPGTKNILENRNAVELINYYNENNKTVAAICAAPSVLGQLGILKGKKAVCYPGFEDKLIGAEALKEEVVVDGNIITSRGMGTAIAFGLKIIEHLENKELAEKIASSIVYKSEK